MASEPCPSTGDAALAVQALYTLGYLARRIDTAIDRLTRLAPRAELPLPLLRIVARHT
ncbi:hypothetical protein [Phytoactinopolyspora halotolerans]|uniref:hypothetical protein n=1 Tax=Phytoactinopolyspora halotolerans TaxID=1981512 RepID=UPI001FE8DA04|nr:hypothetical protein [Phytoactinopolyspora halotolerans]